MTMKTAAYKNFCKTLFFVSAIFLKCFFCGFVYAEEEKKWILAAEEFSLTQKNIYDPSLIAIKKALPSIILEQIAENISRQPDSEEILNRKLYSLQKKRLDLFLQLSKEVQERDAIMLNNYSRRRNSIKIKDAEDKILSIKKKIDENLKEEKEAENKYKAESNLEKNITNKHNQGKKEFNLLKNFINGGEESPEKITLYKDNFSELFNAGTEIQKQGYGSFDFEQACTSANINGLITGNITIYTSFLSASITLYQYPGARIIGYAVEAGSIDDLKSIAKHIAQQLTPKITDIMHVELVFNITPPKAAKKAIMTLDDLVYKEIPERLSINSGIHSVEFSAQGYDPVSVSYSFTGNKNFLIKVNMQENKEGQAFTVLNKEYSGDIFANGIFTGKIDEINRFTSISINNKAVLGRFLAEDGTGADFYIKPHLLIDNSYIEINAKPFDRSDYIEKRRKLMYTSYSILITSLIPYFYTYGNYIAADKAFGNNYGINEEDVKNWNSAYNICSGITIGCTAFWIYELVRYFNSANTVLPAEGKLIKKRKLLNVVKKSKEREKEKIKKQEEAEKALPNKEELKEDTSEKKSDVYAKDSLQTGTEKKQISTEKELKQDDNSKITDSSEQKTKQQQ